MDAGDAVITISGEVDDLEAELQKVDTAVQQTCDGISQNFAAAGAAIAGFGAVVVGVFALTIKAAAKEEAMTTRLIVALRNVGIEYALVGGSLEATIDQMQQMTSFADTDMRESLSILVLATGDLEEALDLLNLAMDMSVGMGTNLVSSTSRLGMALAGNWGMLQRYIPVLAQCSTEEEKWAKLREMFAGQAEAYGSILAGEFDLLKNNLGDVAELIGNVLSPVLVLVIDRVNEFIQWIKTLNPFLVKVVVIGTAVAGTLALMGGGLVLLAALTPTLIKLLTALTALTLPKLLVSLKALTVAMWHFVASMLAALASLGPLGWAMLATGIALIATGVALASKYSKQVTQDLGDTRTAADGLTFSIDDGTIALEDYNAQVAEASGLLGDLEEITLGTAGAQGKLASSIGGATRAIEGQLTAAQALALVLRNLMGYAAGFPGGMTMEQLERYWAGPGERRVKPPGREWMSWEDYISEYYPGWGKEPEPPRPPYVPGVVPQFQHGTILTEPTLLWGIWSKRLLGKAGEAGPERIGPALQSTTITNRFAIASLVVREEADIPRIAQALHDLQEMKYRTKGTRR